MNTEENAMDSFSLVYDEFIPGQEALREVLTSTGNGYFCTRGTAEWQDSDETHYAGTYAHGGYNRETTITPIPRPASASNACSSVMSSPT